ncbi:MAG: hypothetical protein ACRDG2_05565, partial [Actinomycetota bacterium]
GAHDSACGCSHDQVAIDVDARFAEAREIGEAIVERALSALGDQMTSSGVVRFNPSPFERDGIPPLGYAVTDRAPESPLAGSTLEPLTDGSGVSVDGTPVRLFDEPDVGDLYNWCPADDDHRVSPPNSIGVEGRAFEAEWDGLRVEVRVSRRADGLFFRLEGVIQNEREDHRLRLHVQLPNATDRAVAGAPFELVDRPLVGEGSSVETASPTWPARHVVMASRTAVLHEGVFEYEVVDGRELAVTLLRCVGAISKEKLATRPWPAGPGTPTPNAQMIGKTEFVLGVWPHAEQDALLPTWEWFGLPIAKAPGRGGGDRPPSGSLLPVDGDIELSNVRRREGHVTLTVWNRRQDRSVEVFVADHRHEIGPGKIALVPF